MAPHSLPFPTHIFEKGILFLIFAPRGEGSSPLPSYCLLLFFFGQIFFREKVIGCPSRSHRKRKQNSPPQVKLLLQQGSQRMDTPWAMCRADRPISRFFYAKPFKGKWLMSGRRDVCWQLRSEGLYLQLIQLRESTISRFENFRPQKRLRRMSFPYTLNPTTAKLVLP